MTPLQPHKDTYAIRVPLEMHSFRLNPILDMMALFGSNGKDRETIITFTPPGNWQILGEATSNHATFDIGPLIGGNTMSAKHNIESFYSLLAANGVYFVNHLGDGTHGVMIGWRSFEDKLVEKVLVIQKI